MRRLLILLLVIAFIIPLGVYGWAHEPGAFDGKIHLRYMAWGNPEQNATDKALLERFEQLHPNIKVDYTLVPPNFYYQKLQIALLAGTAPDVFRMDLYFLPKYFPYGYFMPVDELSKDDPSFDRSDFYPQALHELTYKGKLMGLNTLFGGHIIYYNKKLIRAAGLEDPYEVYKRGDWTFDMLIKYAQAMTKRENGNVIQYGLNVDTFDLWWMIWGFGGDILSEDGTVSVDQPAAIKGLTFYHDLEAKWHVIPRMNENTGGAFAFESGRVGMVTDFAGVSPRLRRLMPGDDWDVVPIPRRDKNTPAVNVLKGNGLLASANTKHRKEAWMLMKFLTGPEAEMAYYGPKLRRCIPTRISVSHDPEFLSNDGRPPYNTEAFLALYEAGRELPVTSYWWEWQPYYTQWLERMNLLNSVTPEEAGKGMAQDIRRVVREAQK